MKNGALEKFKQGIPDLPRNDASRTSDSVLPATGPTKRVGAAPGFLPSQRRRPTADPPVHHTGATCGGRG